ncbi:hypothetical protein TcWFU_002610 [Taenia crassiceps]|uniref:DUF3719 domain-containing protein n=1 Tax=Taenia crassiceps TaxID=6207 RepID=A0ABR4QDB1_9CEST
MSPLILLQLIVLLPCFFSGPLVLIILSQRQQQQQHSLKLREENDVCCTRLASAVGFSILRTVFATCTSALLSSAPPVSPDIQTNPSQKSPYSHFSTRNMFSKEVFWILNLIFHPAALPFNAYADLKQQRNADTNGTLACTPIVSTGQKYITTMLFNEREIKPNILTERFSTPNNTDAATISPGPGGDGHISTSQEKREPLPPLPTPCDRYFDLNTFSSEGCSFTTNPNDINSLTSSDWGDEACEIDRRRSQHVQELFDAIDQMLYEPGCLKNTILSTQIRRSSELKSGLCESPNQLTSSDFASVKHLIPECEEWVAKFPHFRLHGVQIRPHPVKSRGQPQQWESTMTQQSGLSDPHFDASMLTTRRFNRLPEASRVSQTPLNLQNVSRLYLSGSNLVIQGQRIQALPSVNTTTWLNRSRVSRMASRTQVGAANARFPQSDNSRTFLSTLPENPPAVTPHRNATRLTNKSKKSLYSVRQWESQTFKAPENRVIVRPPQCAAYMGSRTTKSQDGLMRKEALTQTLVVIILNEVLAVLKAPSPENLQDSPAAAKLTKSFLTLNEKEFESGGGARMAISPDLKSSTKTRSPSRLQDRTSPECPVDFVLSGKSFSSTSDLSNLSSTTPAFISISKKSNTKFSVTWPNRPDSKISPTLFDSTRTSPIPSGCSNTSGGQNKLQNGSTLPPITINRTNLQVIPRQFRRPDNETPRLPSIFSTTAKHPDGEDNGANYHYSAKVSLHGRSNQTAVLEHLSQLREALNNESLPHHEMNMRRNHSCVTKFPPYPSKTTQIQCSIQFN